MINDFDIELWEIYNVLLLFSCLCLQNNLIVGYYMRGRDFDIKRDEHYKNIKKSKKK